MSQSQTDNGDDVPHPSYTASARKAYGSQQGCADAWAEGKFPTHNMTMGGGAKLYSSPNFEGIQYPDGRGKLMHYRTREAIRTRNGLVVSNEQCWSAGFAHCSAPRSADATLPLSALESFLDDEHDVYDVERVVKDGLHRVAVLDGYGVAFGRDSSAVLGTHPFAFRVSPDEIELAEEIGVEAMIDQVLTPDAVEASGLDVVDSSEFTRTKHYNDEKHEAMIGAHKDAGGETSMIETGRWRDDYEGIAQHFRADLRGEVVVRQGDQFFIPTARDDVPDEGRDVAADRMGSHRPLRRGGGRSPIPRECEHCGASNFDMLADGEVSCRQCGSDVDRHVYAHGEIIHADNDHNAINLGEIWHLVVTHGRDVLTYRTGSPHGHGGGGGWD